MAIDSLNLTKLSDLAGTEAGKMKLAEEYKGIIENVGRRTISSLFKNQRLSGDPQAGTLVAKRFASAKSEEYGTARAARKGKPGRGMEVAVDIDIDKEIMEEYEEKDIRLGGVPGLLSERNTAITRAMVRELDENFFLVAVGKRKESDGTIGTVDGGTEVTVSGDTIKDRVTAVVMKLHTAKNEFVDGIEKEDIHVVLSPEAYEEMRDYIDTKGNANVKTDVAEFGRYHGAWIYSNVHQPEGIEIIAMCTGAIAEPVMADEYQAKQIELSNAYAIGMFFHYGCKVVMPDLIFYSKKPGATGASETEEAQTASAKARSTKLS